MTDRFASWWKRARPGWWDGPAPALPPKAERVEPRAPMRINAAAVARAAHAGGMNPYARGLASGDRQLEAWRVPDYPRGVLPGGRTTLAMDDATALQVQANFGYATTYHGLWSEGIGFMGYPYLAELTQRPEYRIPSEVFAEEVTRKWLKVNASGDDDLTDKVKELEQDLLDFNVREVVHDVVKLDGFFGRAGFHVNVGTDADDAELRTPLLLRPEKVGRNKLKGFRVVDPTWTAPNDYNSIDPLSPTFYKPQTWFVMGRLIHASRMPTLVARPVPELLKPAYNFGGLALSQMLKPYVDNWLRTRQSVSDLVQSFTIFVLETNMQAFLQGGDASTEAARAQFFTNLRDSRGLMMIDKETEGFQNVSAPLGSLDHLQAQAQEHMASVSRMPLVKMTGISPSGLNVTSDGEIRVFYDTINAFQTRLVSPLITTILQLLQLNRYGSVDPAIGHEWIPLYQLDEAGSASVRKTDADTDAVLIESGVIDPAEARDRIAASATSPYHGLEGPPPDPPEPPPGGGGPQGLNEDPAAREGSAGENGSESGANAADAAEEDDDEPPLDLLKLFDKPRAFDPKTKRFAEDASEFKEADHPRGQPGNPGQFGPGGGGGSKAKTPGASSPDPSPAESYAKSLNSKKGSAAGLIKHMIQSGDYSAQDIFNHAKETFNISVEGKSKSFSPTSMVKWYRNDMQKKGLNPPPLPATSKKSLPETVKTDPDPGEKRAEKKVGPKPEEAPEKKVGPKPEEAPEKKVGPKPEEAPEKKVGPKPEEAPEKTEEKSPEPVPVGAKTDGPKTIEEALAGKRFFDPVEKAYSAIVFKHADPKMLKAIAGTHPLTSVRINGESFKCYYRPGQHYIQMDKTPEKATGVSGDIYAHEFGHAMDWNGTERNSSERASSAVKSDSRALLAKTDNITSVHEMGRPSSGAGGFSKWITPKLEGTGLNVADVEAFTGSQSNRAQFLVHTLKTGEVSDHSLRKLSDYSEASNKHYRDSLMQDFVGSMTLNKIGVGHSNKYYEENPRFRQAEMFANYVALTSSEHGKVYRALLHKIAPKSCQVFDEIIEERANGK